MKQKLYILLHVLVWLILLSSDIVALVTNPGAYVTQSVVASGMPKPLFYFIFATGYMLVPLTGFYGCYLLVGPAIFDAKKVIRAIVLAVLVLIAMVLVRYLVEFQVFIPLLKFHNYFGKTPELWFYVKNCISFSYDSCFFGLAVYFVAASQKLEREKREMQQEKIQAELSFLRSQVNPHFLFNTINDIYALTYQKSDLAPEALLKLSGILRYMLYEGNRDIVPLQKELEYMEDYISLQRIGLKDQLQLEVTIKGEAGRLLIAPLLLIPFVENIFKHGVVNDAAQPARLHITIHQAQLTLESINVVKQQQKDGVRGIGLQNVERRLQLLYPGKHTFVVKEEETVFRNSMQLELGQDRIKNSNT